MIRERELPLRSVTQIALLTTYIYPWPAGCSQCRQTRRPRLPDQKKRSKTVDDMITGA